MLADDERRHRRDHTSLTRPRPTVVLYSDPMSSSGAGGAGSGTRSWWWVRRAAGRVRPAARLPRVAAALSLAVLLACGASGEGAQPDITAVTSAPGTTTGATAPPAPPPTAPPPPPRSVTIAATGDVLVHAAVRHQAALDGGGPHDFVPMLAPLQPHLAAADLAICHLETPLAPHGGPYSGYPMFSAPPEVAVALAAVGYDACSTASNHSLDQGLAGLSRTLDVLDAAGVRHAGTARSEAEAATPTVLEVGDVSVALLSYTYGFNGLPLPASAPFAANLLQPGGVVAAAERARASGAEVVVASLHWGTEYQTDPSPEQLAAAEEITRSGAVDLILGHHAHVVQPLDVVHDTWVVYGLGNSLVSPQHDFADGATREGLLVRFTLTEEATGFEVTEVQLVPTFVSAAPVRVLDLTARQPGDPRLVRAAARTEEVTRRLLDPMEAAVVVPVPPAG